MEEPGMSEAGRARLFAALKEEASPREPARLRAQLMGWSVDPGNLRVSGPLDWLAQENNERSPKRRRTDR